MGLHVPNNSGALARLYRRRRCRRHHRGLAASVLPLSALGYPVSILLMYLLLI